jgi:hypothetical protein
MISLAFCLVNQRPVVADSNGILDASFDFLSSHAIALGN